VALLGVTLFLIGFGIDPLAFAPMSELLGRRVIYISTLGVSVAFFNSCALANDIQTMLVCRARNCYVGAHDFGTDTSRPTRGAVR